MQLSKTTLAVVLCSIGASLFIWNYNQNEVSNVPLVEVVQEEQVVIHPEVEPVNRETVARDLPDIVDSREIRNLREPLYKVRKSKWLEIQSNPYFPIEHRNFVEIINNRIADDEIEFLKNNDTWNNAINTFYKLASLIEENIKNENYREARRIFNHNFRQQLININRITHNRSGLYSRYNFPPKFFTEPIEGTWETNQGTRNRFNEDVYSLRREYGTIEDIRNNIQEICRSFISSYYESINLKRIEQQNYVNMSMLEFYNDISSYYESINLKRIEQQNYVNMSMLEFYNDIRKYTQEVIDDIYGTNIKLREERRRVQEICQKYIDDLLLEEFPNITIYPRGNKGLHILILEVQQIRNNLMSGNHEFIMHKRNAFGDKVIDNVISIDEEKWNEFVSRRNNLRNNWLTNEIYNEDIILLIDNLKNMEVLLSQRKDMINNWMDLDIYPNEIKEMILSYRTYEKMLSERSVTFDSNINLHRTDLMRDIIELNKLLNYYDQRPDVSRNNRLTNEIYNEDIYPNEIKEMILSYRTYEKMLSERSVTFDSNINLHRTDLMRDIIELNKLLNYYDQRHDVSRNWRDFEHYNEELSEKVEYLNRVETERPMLFARWRIIQGIFNHSISKTDEYIDNIIKEMGAERDRLEILINRAQERARNSN